MKSATSTAPSLIFDCSKSLVSGVAGIRIPEDCLISCNCAMVFTPWRIAVRLLVVQASSRIMIAYVVTSQFLEAISLTTSIMVSLDQ